MIKDTNTVDLERLFKPLNNMPKLFNKGDEVVILDELLQEKPLKTEPADFEPDVANLIGRMIDSVKRIEPRVHFYDVGTVQHVGNGVATISGLPRVSINELVTFPTGVQGMVLNLDRDHIDVILLGEDEGIRGGDLVTASGDRAQVPVGMNLLGRVLNPLGEALDFGPPIDASTYRYLEQDAPGVIERLAVDRPLQTGWKTIDALLPIGRGQRELIIGDRKTGKTTLAVDTIINQIDNEVVCIYVSVGQKKSSTLAVIEELRKTKAIDYTTIIFASPDDPPALRYMAPYVGCTMAEHFMYQGQDVLIIYDDISKHADSYRELSLLLRRPPGREAYPGDIFYLHSRLLERSAKIRWEDSSASITALPIVEIQSGNLSAFIPTNLISITDGQILLDSELFNRGIRPAIDIGKSVSRVGGKAQSKAMRKVTGDLKLKLSQYEEVARFARLGTEVDDTTRRQIETGKRLQAMLNQSPGQPLKLAKQVIIMYAAINGYLDEISVEGVPDFEYELLGHIVDDYPNLLRKINRSMKLDKETIDLLEEAIHDYLDENKQDEEDIS